MIYCETCDSLLRHEQQDGKIVFMCPDCDYKEENSGALNSFTLTEKIDNKNAKIEVVEVPSIEGISSDLREELREQYREAMSSLE